MQQLMILRVAPPRAPHLRAKGGCDPCGVACGKEQGKVAIGKARYLLNIVLCTWMFKSSLFRFSRLRSLGGGFRVGGSRGKRVPSGGKEHASRYKKIIKQFSTLGEVLEVPSGGKYLPRYLARYLAEVRKYLALGVPRGHASPGNPKGC